VHGSSHIGQGEAVACDEGRKFRQLGEGRYVLFQLLTGFFLGRVADLAAEEGLGVEVARDQFQVQFQVAQQFAHLGRGKRIGGQQRLLRVLGLDVFEHHGGLAERALVGLQVRHLAQRAGGLVGLAHPGQFFLKRHAFFEQGELDFVVVVAGREAAECEHESLRCGLVECPSYRRPGHRRVAHLTRR
jgi:hypothetical protein